MPDTSSIADFLATYTFQYAMTHALLVILYDEFWLDQASGDRFDAVDWMSLSVAALILTFYLSNATDLYPSGLPELRDS